MLRELLDRSLEVADDRVREIAVAHQNTRENKAVSKFLSLY